jgi:hypothetical protein
MAAGFVLTVAGSAIWPLVAWRWTGIPGAYTRTEAAWHHGQVRLFAGLMSLRHLTAYGEVRWFRLLLVVTIAVVVALTVLAVRSPRLDPVLVAWCVAYLPFELSVAGMKGDELRMLLPLFPLVAVACGVASRTLSAWWPRRAVLLAGLGILGQYAWVMAFVVIVPGLSHAP